MSKILVIVLCRCNFIHTLRYHSFQGLNDLFFLQLEANNLTQIDQSAFAGIPKLNQTYLQHNLLQSLDRNVFWGNGGVFQTKLFLDMEENPVLCSLDLCWMAEYIKLGKLEMRWGEEQMCAESPSVSVESYLNTADC